MSAQEEVSRYRDLTQRQTEALSEIGAGNAFPSGVHPTILRVLTEKGLIVRTRDKVIGHDRFGVIRRPQFEMPVHEHIAWCEWCAEQDPSTSLNVNAQVEGTK